MQNVIFDQNRSDIPRLDSRRQCAPANVVDETFESGVAEEIERRSRSAERCLRRALAALEQNRIDDIHWLTLLLTIRRPHGDHYRSR
jgi:hypothetical protein